jgi:rhamnose transport system permease protein
VNIFQRYPWLKRWETLLLVLLILVIGVNMQVSDAYLDGDNISNIFRLSIEKAIVVVIMAFVIINAEIDLSVASIMGLSASLLAYLYDRGTPVETGILITLVAGFICGVVNGFFIAYLGIPSLVVTLAGLILYRGLARVLLENQSVGDFPDWFTGIAQHEVIGPFPITILMFAVLFVVCLVILQYTTFGRYVYAIGNNLEGSEYAGIKVRRVKMQIFIASATVATVAGILFAARLGNVRANAAEGFELDIITIVLLGGVSIFGGKGTMLGVGLSLLLVLNMRNGMNLSNVNGFVQSSVVGLLLILSVLVPNMAQSFQTWWARRSIGTKDKRKPIKEVRYEDSPSVT